MFDISFVFSVVEILSEGIERLDQFESRQGVLPAACEPEHDWQAKAQALERQLAEVLERERRAAAKAQALERQLAEVLERELRAAEDSLPHRRMVAQFEEQLQNQELALTTLEAERACAI